MDGDDALEAMSAMGVVRGSVIGDADGRRLMRRCTLLLLCGRPAEERLDRMKRKIGDNYW